MIRIVRTRTLMALRAENDQLRNRADAAGRASADARRDADDARRVADDWRKFAADAGAGRRTAERELEMVKAERDALTADPAADDAAPENPDRVRESKVSEINARYDVCNHARRAGDDNLVRIADADLLTAIRGSTPEESAEAARRLNERERQRAAENRSCHPAAWVIRQVIAEQPDPQIREAQVAKISAAHVAWVRADEAKDARTLDRADAELMAVIHESTDAERLYDLQPVTAG